jgi:ABC-type glutathione transport system ATPase component
MNIQALNYKELVAKATENGFEKAHQTKKETLVEFLANLTEKVEKKKREKKEIDPRILEMSGGEYTRREIAKALNLKYSDVYFALKNGGLTAKPVKKSKEEIN